MKQSETNACHADKQAHLPMMSLNSTVPGPPLVLSALAAFTKGPSRRVRQVGPRVWARAPGEMRCVCREGVEMTGREAHTCRHRMHMHTHMCKHGHTYAWMCARTCGTEWTFES